MKHPNIITLTKAVKLSQLVQLRLRKQIAEDSARREDLLETLRSLESCEPNNRCNSGACPVCTRRAQVEFVDVMSDLLHDVGEPIAILSIVLPLRLRPGCSPQHANRQFGRMLAQLHRDLRGLPWVIGGIDVSANEHADGAHVPYYQFQFWAFAEMRHVRRVERQLRSRFAPDTKIARPLRIMRFDGNRKALAYALKPNFDRRVTLPAIRDKEARRLGIQPRRQNTKNRPLRSSQEAELRLMLHEFGLDRRLFLIGACKTESGLKLNSTSRAAKASPRRAIRIVVAPHR